MRIDRHFAPRPPRSVLSVEVDGDRVLYDERTGCLHALNDTAAVVWSCCDGALTLGELVSELSAAYQAPTAEVRKGVYAVVRQLVAEGLLVGPGANGNSEDADPMDAVVRSAAVALEAPCAPCIKRLDGQQWVGAVGLRVGDLDIAVRANTESALEALARALAPHVTGPTDAPAHYSLFLAPPSSGHVRDLHRVYYSWRLRVRTRSPKRAVLALAAHLGAHLDGSISDRVVVSASAVVRDGRAVLLAPDVVRHREAIEPRLNQLGIAVHDAPSVRLDGDATIVLTEPAVRIDEGALAELDDAVHLEREVPQPEAGARRLCGWVMPSRDGTTGPMDSQIGLAALMPTVRNVGAMTTGTALDTLARQLADVPVLAFRGSEPAALVDEIVALLDRV